MRHRFGFLQLLILPSFVHATPINYKPLTTRERPVCEATNPCRIFESNSTFELSFEVTERASNKTLGPLKIRNLKDGSDQTFNLRGMNTIAQTKFFQFFEVGLRSGGKIDLAVYAYDSAREGKMYHYLIYDDRAQSFVLSNETIPHLESTSATNEYESSFHKVKYRVDAKSKIVPFKDDHP